jgi:hypothetical protein
VPALGAAICSSARMSSTSASAGCCFTAPTSPTAQALGMKPKAPKQVKQAQLDKADMQKLLQGSGGGGGATRPLLARPPVRCHVACPALHGALCCPSQ